MATYIHVPDGAPAVPKINVTVDESDFRRGALELMKELRPSWRPFDVQMKFFTDGITNKLLGCYVGAVMQDVVLVRIYGNKTELLVDRENEVKSFRVLHAHNCAPSLYCTFNNGLCYEFLPGTALEPEHIRSPSVSRLIARQLAKYHTIHAHNGWVPQSDMWLKMGKYFDLIPKYFKDPEQNARLLREVPSMQCLRDEVLWLQQSVSVLGSPVVLCHNDLLCKNIIYNEDGDSVKFIDYEYAGYNYQAYDIGNHFNEFAGLNEVDYSHYPERAFQLQWLRSYLEAYKELKGQHSAVTDREVEVLYVQVNRFALASHFFWGLWALIQAKVSTIEFDFLGYAVLRFDQYFKMKAEAADLKLPK
ncbi:ethanolamine kinase 1 [Thalassophryne amazonica]|uniref:ethanolamine kinase 1 n=1 Tax=Thalassophryne amazonica TaxID=390379 RepID=UPI0014724816|nr:ethanolamine kinase 1 [Thalassophryne amazonica]